MYCVHGVRCGHVSERGLYHFDEHGLHELYGGGQLHVVVDMYERDDVPVYELRCGHLAQRGGGGHVRGVHSGSELHVVADVYKRHDVSVHELRGGHLPLRWHGGPLQDVRGGELRRGQHLLHRGLVWRDDQRLYRVLGVRGGHVSELRLYDVFGYGMHELRSRGQLHVVADMYERDDVSVHELRGGHVAQQRRGGYVRRVYGGGQLHVVVDVYERDHVSMHRVWIGLLPRGRRGGHVPGVSRSVTVQLGVDVRERDELSVHDL